MKLVVLTRTYGPGVVPVLVNLDLVQVIQAEPSGSSLEFEGRQISVEETPAEILELASVIDPPRWPA